jgi:hypothetical protein
MHRNRQQTWLGRVTVLGVRALRTHEKPAVGLQSGHDFACGHAVRIISVTLCPVKSANSLTASIRYKNESRSWIYARVERDEMPYIRVGGLIRFVPSQLRDWTFAKDRTRG